MTSYVYSHCKNVVTHVLLTAFIIFLILQVALQFPDFLLPDAVELTLLLKGKTGRDVVILGDTSYGRYRLFLGCVISIYG